MTDMPPSVPTTARSGRGVKIALAISVALNLAVAGMVLGAFLSDDGPRRGMPRDLGFGPFTEALSPEDRRALRRAFMDMAPDFHSAHTAARAEFDTLLATLRATPLDPAALTTALTAGADGNALTAVGATDGTIDVSALVTDFICAVAIDASAKIVFLTCPR